MRRTLRPVSAMALTLAATIGLLDFPAHSQQRPTPNPAQPAANRSPVTTEAQTAQAAYAALESDFESWLLRENPETATALGDHRFDDRISDLSLAAMDRRAGEAQSMLDRLNAIAQPQLSAANQVNVQIMRRQLSETVEGNRFGQRMMLFTTYAGWHQNFAGLADNMPFNSPADYRSYLARLAQYPAMNDEALRITQMAVDQGYVLPCEVLGSSERSISGLINDDPVQSRYYAPFARTRPNVIDEEDWAAMQVQARTLISSAINPALAKHRDFFVGTYMPHCTRNPSISAQPGGADYYAFRIRQETTTAMSADEIHQLGLSEVARIRAEMAEVAQAAGYPNREAFIHELRTNPRYFASSPEDLMRHVARTTRRIDGFMPRLFGHLPRLPYTLREIPAETAEGTTTAYYSQGAMSAGVAGTYYINTSKLDQRPLWEIPALSMHEAVPGHHNQISLQQELPLPMWRRNFTGFTAFVEGWGLYSERLGVEMGLYDTPETNMGRLSYEMWRACRLVVDTGIHSRGWSKPQAVAYMRDNSALTEANIDAEVNRYISWPGQALGYKIGELRIRALRTRAEQVLGERFDVRAFHDAVLSQGAVPLDVLEAQISAWIAAQSEAIAAPR